MTTGTARKAWSDIEPEQRKRVSSDGATTPADARIALAYAVWQRRRAYQILGLSLLLFAAWLAAATTVDPGGKHHIATLAVLFGVAAVVLGAFYTGIWLFSRSERLRDVNVLTSVADAPAAMPMPMTVHWKYHRPVRIMLAAVVCVAAIGIIVMTWTDRHDHLTLVLLYVELPIVVLYRLVLNPWPTGSSFAHVATIDSGGVTVPALGLAAPWTQVTNVRVHQSGLLIHVASPDAVIASMVSPWRRRILRRWFRRNGNAIRLNFWKLRESPESMVLALTQYRNNRVG